MDSLKVKLTKKPNIYPSFQNSFFTNNSLFLERSVTEEIVESREILPSPLISHSTDPDDQRYLESLRQNLSYEEQVELEIQRRRRRGENDEMQPELLSVVDEEEELGLHGLFF